MSKTGILTQAGFVAAALGVLFAFDHRLSGLVLLAVVVGLSALLLVMNLPWSKRRRAAATRVGARASVVAIGAGVIASGPALVFLVDRLLDRTSLPHLPLDDGGHVYTVQAMAVLVAVAVGSLYVSSLVDWCYVLPRMRGELGDDMPCQQSMARRWAKLTCLWLLHRLAAILLFVFALSATVTIAAIEWLGFSDPLGAAIGAAATLFAGFYLRRAATVIAFVNNPPVHVGDKVVLADEPEHSPFPDSSYYVVDVSVEGVRLLLLADDDAMVEPDSPREHDRLLDVEAAFALVRARRRFGACSRERCNGVNPYCPRAPERRARAAALAPAP